MSRIALSLTFLAMSCSPCVAAPSFDCKSASSPIEKAICGDDMLSKLDADLAEAYSSAQKAGAVTQVQQRSWLKRRNAECDGPNPSDCLRKMLPDRIAELSAAADSSTNSLSFVSSNLFAAGLSSLGVIWLDNQTLAFLGDSKQPDEKSVSLFVWTQGQKPVALLDNLNVYSSIPTFLSLGNGRGILRLKFGEGATKSAFYRFDGSSAQIITAQEYFEDEGIPHRKARADEALEKEAAKLAGNPPGEVSVVLSPDESKAVVWIDPTYFDATRRKNLASWSSNNCWAYYEVEFSSSTVRKRCVPYGGWQTALFSPLQTKSKTFIVGTAFNYASWESSAFGIYRIVGGEVQNMLPGQFISRWAVSPDGCKVALVHQDGGEIDANASRSAIDIWNACGP